MTRHHRPRHSRNNHRAAYPRRPQRLNPTATERLQNPGDFFSASRRTAVILSVPVDSFIEEHPISSDKPGGGTDAIRARNPSGAVSRV